MGVNESNQVGHWESDSIVVLNDILLKELGADWTFWNSLTTDTFSIARKKDIIEDIARHIRLEFPGTADFVLKDPRISRLIKLYLEAFEENGINPHILISLRNPLEVVESLAERDMMAKGDAAMLWLRYTLDAEFHSRGHKRAFIHYEKLLSKPAETLTRISNSLSLSYPQKIEAVLPQITSFLQDKMRHHHHTLEDVTFDPIMRGWVDLAYSHLLILCTNPHDERALLELDKLRSEFDHVCAIMENMKNEGVSTAEVEKLERDMKIRIAEVEKEAEAKMAEQAQKLTEAQDLRKSLEIRISDFIKKQTQIKLEAQTVEKELDTQVKNIEGTKITIDNMATQIQAHRKELANATAKITSLQSEYDLLIIEQKRTSNKVESVRKNREAVLAKTQIKLKTANTKFEKSLLQQAKLETQLQQLKGEANQLSKTLEHKGHELSVALKEQEVLKNKLKESEKNAQKLKENLKESEKNAQKLKEDLKESETVTQKLREDLGNSQKIQADLETQISDQKEKFDQVQNELKHQLSLSTEELEILKANLGEIERQKGDMVYTINKLQVDHRELLDTNFDLVADIQTLKAELEREKRTLFRPAVRKLRSATGKGLRFILPTKLVDNLAIKVPPKTSEIKLLSSGKEPIETENPHEPVESRGLHSNETQ